MTKEKAYAIWRKLKEIDPELPVVVRYDREFGDWIVEIQSWDRLSRIPIFAGWCARNKNLVYTSQGETRVLKRRDKLILY